MSNAVLKGFPRSSYVITARAVAALKGLDMAFEPMSPGEHKQPGHLTVHPWGKVPVFEYGEVRLFETSAIARFIDEVFDGAALQPTCELARAKMTQWISVTNCYLYPHFVPPYIIQYAFAGEGGPDRAVIDAALPAIERDLDAIEAAIGDGSYMVEDSLTLADAFVAPLLMGLSRYDEGRSMVEARPGIQRLIAAMMDLPAFMSAFPQG